MTDTAELQDTSHVTIPPSWIRQCEIAARTGETDTLIYTVIGQLPFLGLGDE